MAPARLTSLPDTLFGNEAVSSGTRGYAAILFTRKGGVHGGGNPLPITWTDATEKPVGH
jgi:hypothetical protein